jgi:hypothetical protein
MLDRWLQLSRRQDRLSKPRQRAQTGFCSASVTRLERT